MNYILLSMVLIGLSSSVSNSYNYKNQATLLFYFSKYIQWPASYNEGDFIVGVYGEEEVAEDIKRILAVRQIDNRKIIVKRFNSTSQVPKKCNLLYLSANKSSSFYRIENHLKRTHTLLVTEKTGLGARGSHINLIIENNRMKFELNKASIAKSGLKVSSALIKQAIEI